MNDADEKVARLILSLVREGDHGWKSGYPPPEHFAECPDTRVVRTETQVEFWFDTGVDAVRLTALLACPHRPDTEWEWADLGELPYMLEDLDRLTP